MQNQDPPPVDTLYQTYEKTLYKTTGEEGMDSILDMITPNSPTDTSSNVETSASDVGSGDSTSITPQATGAVESGKSTFDNTVPGYILGFDPTDGNTKFYIGNSTQYINWDGNTFTIAGDFRLGNSITVTPADDIQAALTSLAPTGGIVYLEAGTYNLTANIAIPTGVSLIGAGVSNTILDFGSAAYGITATGDGGSTPIKGFTLSGFTVQKSTATAAIDLYSIQNAIVSNLQITLCTGIGLRVQLGFIFQVLNVYLYINTGDGLQITNNCTVFYIANVTSWANNGNGFTVSSGAQESAVLIGCFATENGGDGFHTSSANIALTNCTANSSTGSNFNLNTGTTMVGCASDDGIAFTYAATITLAILSPANPAGLYKTTTVNATGNATINASAAGNAGQEITLVIVNDASTNKTITFGTNFKPNGTLTGTTSKAAVVTFISDGTNWYEKSRTTGL